MPLSTTPTEMPSHRPPMSNYTVIDAISGVFELSVTRQIGQSYVGAMTGAVAVSVIANKLVKVGQQAFRHTQCYNM